MPRFAPRARPRWLRPRAVLPPEHAEPPRAAQSDEPADERDRGRRTLDTVRALHRCHRAGRRNPRSIKPLYIMSDTALPSPPASEPTRRDFLYVATATVAGIGAAATLVPLIAQMNPDAATLAAGGPVDFDLSKVAPGQQVVVRWRSRPIFITHRTDALLKDLQSPRAARPAPPIPIPSDPAAALRGELAPLGEAGIRRAGRHLHPSRLHPAVLSAAERQPAGRRLAGRLFLPLPRLEIRSWPAASSKACRRPTICRCRPIATSATPRSASAKIRPTPRSISARSGRSERPRCLPLDRAQIGGDVARILTGELELRHVGMAGRNAALQPPR